MMNLKYQTKIETSLYYVNTRNCEKYKAYPSLFTGLSWKFSFFIWFAEIFPELTFISTN